MPERASRTNTPRVWSGFAALRSGASEVKATTVPSADSDGSVIEPRLLMILAVAPVSRCLISTSLRPPRTSV